LGQSGLDKDKFGHPVADDASRNSKHVECAAILSLVVVKAGGWKLEAGGWRLEAGVFMLRVWFIVKCLFILEL
jgi:hypothetical protein